MKNKRYERNKVSHNVDFISNLCKIKNIKNFSFIQAQDGDLYVNINHNMKNWLLCVDEDGKIIRYDKNSSHTSKGWHTDRKFSNWEQAIDSCSTTHNVKHMGGLDWMDKLLNKNKK